MLSRLGIAFAALFIISDSAAADPVFSYATINDPFAAIGGNTTAAGINNSGVVTGFYVDASGTTHGFVDTSGSFATVDVPSTLAIGGETINGTDPYRINGSGVIAGWYTANGGAVSHGFVDTAGSFTSINDPLAPAGGTTSVVGINDSGTLAGQYIPTGGGTASFVDIGGTFSPIVAPGAVSNTTAVSGINNAGTLVGTYFDSSFVQHSFTDLGGVFTPIIDPAAAAIGVDTLAEGINDAGAVVGEYFDNLGVPHGFLDIGGIFTPIDDPSGHLGTFVIGINDADTVVGYYLDTTGGAQGFMATPEPSAVPEPTSLAILATGLVGLRMMRRRKKSSDRLSP